MKRSIVTLVLAVLVAGVVSSAAFAQAPGDQPTHRFTEIADNVFFAVGTGTVFVQSNALVIVNENDVIVVDSHVTPAAAEALIEAIKTLSDNPVRLLINSHYHFDHAHGNQAFPDSVSIIGSEFTREKLLGDVLNQATFKSFTDPVPEQIAKMKQSLSEATSERAKESLAARIRIQENHLASTKMLVPTPPDITLHRKMTIHRGDREIQLLFLGRGHTGGDVVVYLPADKLVFTGDLLLPFLSYGGDAYVDEWPDTLEALKGLDVETILPGHGGPIKGKEIVTHFQEYLRDLWKKVGEARAKGLSAEEASETIDLRNHREHFRQLGSVGVDVRAVRRAYARMDEIAAGQ